MIPPALQDHEWRDGRSSLRETGVVLSLAGELGLLIEGAQHITIGRNVARLTALIAVANAAMNDDDPHKLKRAHVEALRAAAESGGGRILSAAHAASEARPTRSRVTCLGRERRRLRECGVGFRLSVSFSALG